jgi:hypothetical protein
MWLTAACVKCSANGVGCGSSCRPLRGRINCGRIQISKRKIFSNNFQVGRFLSHPLSEDGLVKRKVNYDKRAIGTEPGRWPANATPAPPGKPSIPRGLVVWPDAPGGEQRDGLGRRARAAPRTVLAGDFPPQAIRLNRQGHRPHGGPTTQRQLLAAGKRNASRNPRGVSRSATRFQSGFG